MRSTSKWIVRGTLLTGGSLLLLPACSVETGEIGPGADETQSEEVAAVYDSLGRELGPVTRNIVLLNEASPEKLPLLARVEVQENELVEFYAFAKGVLVSGTGRPTGGMVFNSEDDLSAEETWNLATKGAPMPEMLAQAIAGRVTTQQAAESLGTQELRPAAATLQTAQPRVTAEGVGSIRQAVNGGWCDTTWYTYVQPGYGIPLGSCGPGYDEAHCWDNVTGSGYAQNPDLWSLRSNACSAIGQITYKVEADESPPSRGSWTVAEDTARWMKFSDLDCDINPFNDCPWIKVSVLNATGDRYHYRFLGDES